MSGPLQGTPSGVPDLVSLKENFSDFVTTIAWLRDKDKGCPWDLEQDFKTLRRYMVEEAYEAFEAMSGDDDADIRDELGDVLLQVVLNAQIANDLGKFSIVDVIRSINEKMRRRHPHVFSAERDSITSQQVRSNWDKIKAAEKSASSKSGEKPKGTGVFAGAEKKHPASLQALHIGKVAAKINFDWDTPEQVFAQLKSEIAELEAEVYRKKIDMEQMSAEIGDVFFSLSQLCRHLKLDPETVAMDGNRKFLRRFRQLESLAANDGVDVKTVSRDALEKLWQRAKDDEAR